MDWDVEGFVRGEPLTEERLNQVLRAVNRANYRSPGNLRRGFASSDYSVESPDKPRLPTLARITADTLPFYYGDATAINLPNGLFNAVLMTWDPVSADYQDDPDNQVNVVPIYGLPLKVNDRVPVIFAPLLNAYVPMRQPEMETVRAVSLSPQSNLFDSLLQTWDNNNKVWIDALPCWLQTAGNAPPADTVNQIPARLIGYGNGRVIYQAAGGGGGTGAGAAIQAILTAVDQFGNFSWAQAYENGAIVPGGKTGGPGNFPAFAQSGSGECRHLVTNKPSGNAVVTLFLSVSNSYYVFDYTPPLTLVDPTGAVDTICYSLACDVRSIITFINTSTGVDQLHVEDATIAQPGVVNTGTQTMHGFKTFVANTFMLETDTTAITTLGPGGGIQTGPSSWMLWGGPVAGGNSTLQLGGTGLNFPPGYQGIPTVFTFTLIPSDQFQMDFVGVGYGHHSSLTVNAATGEFSLVNFLNFPFLSLHTTGGDAIGRSGTFTLTKLTPTGNNGSLTFVGGVFVGGVNPT